MKRHVNYLKYVLRHKFFVFLAGIRLHVPILSLLAHDWDKFKPDEWIPYARTFYAPDGASQYTESPEFAHAWMLHQHRNEHHWQFWLNAGKKNISDTRVFVWDRGEASGILNDGHVFKWTDEITVRGPMSENATREMVADWVGAGRALGFNDPKGWYEKNKEHILLHPITRLRVERLLDSL